MTTLRSGSRFVIALAFLFGALLVQGFAYASEDLPRLRDAEVAAHAAADRGDFRLAGVQYPVHYPTDGPKLALVECARWPKGLVRDVSFIGYEDPAARHRELYLGFYNRTLLSDRRFPFPDACWVRGSKPSSKYAGPVRTAAEAARSGSVRKLAPVLSRDADIDARDVFSETALGWAVHRNDRAMVVALLRAGANPTLTEPRENSLLARAYLAGQTDVARALVDGGARFRREDNLCPHFTSFGIVFRVETPAPPTNSKCSWAGLLASHRQFELLDRLSMEGKFDPYSPNRLDDSRDLDGALLDALKVGDEGAAARLLPIVTGGWLGLATTQDDLRAIGREDYAQKLEALRPSELQASRAKLELYRQPNMGGLKAPPN